MFFYSFTLLAEEIYDNDNCHRLISENSSVRYVGPPTLFLDIQKKGLTSISVF